MTAGIKAALPSCLVLLLLAVGASARQTESPSELAGTYYAGHRFGGSAVELRGDGSYSIKSSSCTSSTERSGTFAFSDGALRFKMLKFVGRPHGDGQEVDLFDDRARREFFGYRRDEKAEPLETESSLSLVRWGGRIYLVGEDDLSNFTHAVNLGLEPRAHLSSEPFYGSFYLREGDLRKEVGGSPSLPERWLGLVLKRPVTATIVRVEVAGDETTATINRGSKSGLRVGMRLLAKDEDPSPWGGSKVVSTGAKTARVRVVSESKVGDKLTTKYEPKGFYRLYR
jgi:hypothetical protein